jgi:hypothetical protein
MMSEHCEKHCEATAFKIVIRGLELDVYRLKQELDEVYGLLSHAHTELRSQLEHGYHVPAIKSTLISIGQYAPKLKAKTQEMEKRLEEKL